MALASENWPEWCDEVVNGYPELLPLDVRLQYFQATSFGPARVCRWDDAFLLLSMMMHNAH